MKSWKEVPIWKLERIRRGLESFRRMNGNKEKQILSDVKMEIFRREMGE